MKKKPKKKNKIPEKEQPTHDKCPSNKRGHQFYMKYTQKSLGGGRQIYVCEHCGYKTVIGL